MMFKWLYDYLHGPDPYPVAMGKFALVIAIPVIAAIVYLFFFMR